MNRNETKAIPKTSPVSGCLLATSGKLGGFSDMSSEEGERTNPAGTPPHPLDEGAVYSIYTCIIVVSYIYPSGELFHFRSSLGMLLGVYCAINKTLHALLVYLKNNAYI